MKNKFFIPLIILLVLIASSILAFYIFKQESSTNENANLNISENKLIPVSTFTHSHGIATDVKDPKKLYIATHHGLYLLENDKDLYQIGASQDDYMGFSIHPEDPEIFYSSGHPESGGNLGFQKTEDGGLTWMHISDVESSPVDFHAMSISTVNPNLIYGWYQGKIYRTENAGLNWKSYSTNFLATSIVADPKNENIAYASTPQGQGVLVSKDKGESWEKLSDDLTGGIVSSFAINPKDSKKMLVFSEKIGGLGLSTDSGITWKKVDEEFKGEEILFIAYSLQNPKNVYVLSHLNKIYKSNDDGLSWNLIR